MSDPVGLLLLVLSLALTFVVAMDLWISVDRLPKSLGPWWLSALAVVLASVLLVLSVWRGQWVFVAMYAGLVGVWCWITLKR